MSGWMGIFDNDSRFGRMVTKWGILIAANLMFLLFSLPVFTIGASLCGLYSVVLGCQRGDGILNPFQVFWRGFTDNFRHGTIFWLGILGGLILCRLEIFWCSQFPGPARFFQYGLESLTMMFFVFAMYIFPVLAAFRAPFARQISNALFFAGRSIPVLLLSGILFSGTLGITLLYPEWRPLFAFYWCFCGFSVLSWLHSKLLLRLFTPYLPKVNGFRQGKEETLHEKKPDQESSLNEMKRMGM